MTLRVNPDLYLETLNELSQTRQQEDTALQQLSTGLRVNSPSDDPAAAAANVGVQAQLADNDQFTTNVTSVSAGLQMGDSTLTSVVSLLNQAISYGTEGGSSSMSDANRLVLATEIQNVQSELLTLANTMYQGQYLFSGTSDQQPFTLNADGTVSYVGNEGVNKVEVSTGDLVQTNLPGDQVFGAGTDSVFNALSQLSTALQSGQDITSAMSSLQAAYQNVTSQQVFYGNTVSQLNNTQTYLNSDKVELSTEQNNLVGVDIDQAVTNMQQAATAREAALTAGGQISQISLLNYLPAPTST
jgi:flagellar hook-associated protein 3 FlgL